MRRLRLVVLCTAAALAVATAPAARADVEPVELEDVTFQGAELTVAGPKGEDSYTPVELEELGTYRMVTTPWREEPAVLEGPLLSEVLAAQGLANAPAIRVTAEDEYSVTVPRDLWHERPVLIATRVNGRAHTRRERGPLQLILPMSEEPKLGDPGMEGYWVWMISAIEPAD